MQLGSSCPGLREGWSKVAGLQLSITEICGCFGPWPNKACDSVLVSLLPQLLYNPKRVFVLLFKCIVPQTLILMGEMPPAVTPLPPIYRQRL